MKPEMVRHEPMHLYLDSADLEQLRDGLESPVVYGVTTNPTLLRRANLTRASLPGFVSSILDLGAQAVQLQVWSQDANGILRDARNFLEYGPPGSIVPKIPATRDGLKAAAILSREGVPVTLTAVYALEQALFASQLGVAYAAPYLGRLEDSGQDGLGLIQKMQTLIGRYPTNQTRLLVASARTRGAVLSLLEIGVGSITVPTKLLPKLLDHPQTLEAERTFRADAEAMG
jgi:transaldolase